LCRVNRDWQRIFCDGNIHEDSRKFSSRPSTRRDFFCIEWDMHKGSKKTPEKPSRNQSDSSTLRAGSDAPQDWTVALLLALVIVIVYGPSISVPFIFDDQAAIIENPSIVSRWPLVGTPEHPER